MKHKTALIYATVDGHTRKICEKLQKVIQGNGQSIDLINIEDFDGDLAPYDKIILGASIRYGVHDKKIVELINTRQEELESKKTAFFSVNLVARKPEKSNPETNPYVVKFFKKISWRPDMAETFAGMLDYPRYSFFDRTMIRLIMWMTKGPTDPTTVKEYTNWEKVEAFGKRLAGL
ncbi:menaquinone-dependent protoporphyrinogen oxidase [Muriicola jejuensis]|uniref:Protoporphyrinogen IX dehydrogenase [quinone] n=1 Tax=Muriicola jejuensis TaxID=504488 RepID=A0A6P0UDM1_9FLAO|nr:menaquinone-dependent protoporphyrinogen IX dehydrogenase [Muriicola jejuensis]NER10019.1 menaquinone-dependent protoporphyrinogen IX dehydrogenase [Muriicola jejuensis]SMP03723.1 menaquinone-dependent protoporphyrinogen oxidase [Muriicola jejuensis]